MEQNKIDRINYLARESRVRELTAEEKSEQQTLRDEFRAACKKSLTDSLDRIEFVDE